MKYLLIILAFTLTTCVSKELQVKYISVKVIDIKVMERFNNEDRVWIHFKGSNNIDYYLAADVTDTIFFKVNTKYPFLVNR